MSDDEGHEDYADYEEIGEGGADEGELSVEAPEEIAEDDERGLDEDAAGSDGDDEEEEEGEEDAGEEAEPLEASASQKAHPQRARVDPILRASNKPRIIREILGDDRETDNRVQRPEAAYMISMRAEEIARYATNFATPSGLHDPFAIAFKEFYELRCPLLLRRPVGVGPAGELLVEVWDTREGMVLPPLTPPVPLGGTAASQRPAPAKPEALIRKK